MPSLLLDIVKCKFFFGLINEMYIFYLNKNTSKNVCKTHVILTLVLNDNQYISPRLQFLSFLYINNLEIYIPFFNLFDLSSKGRVV